MTYTHLNQSRLSFIALAAAMAGVQIHKKIIKNDNSLTQNKNRWSQFNNAKNILSNDIILLRSFSYQMQTTMTMAIHLAKKVCNIFKRHENIKSNDESTV